MYIVQKINKEDVLMEEGFKIFAGNGSIDFAQKMCEYLKVDLGNSETITFS
jgi:phosphoribosylpyrophosphate synthetase